MNKQTEIEKVVRKESLIKMAIEMHWKSYRVVRQIAHSEPQPGQKFRLEAFFGWLEKQRRLAERVVVCSEAGCFGYEPARQMQAMGAEVYVIAPQNWDEQGKRQVNDKQDAQVMSRRLSEYLCGHHKALSVVRIPSREEEARRGQARMRDQLRRELRRMQAMGRSLLWQQRMAVSGRWWSGRSWTQISQEAPGWVIALLERWKKLIESLEKEAEEIEGELRAGAPAQQLLFGEGELTHELLARELIDPQRFRNVRQVGNYFGLCPSESSSAERRRLGSITKHGNPRLRRLMVELTWRMTHFQGATERCAAGEQFSTGRKPVPPLARKSSSRWRAVWPLTSGGSPPVRVQPEELGLVRKVNVGRVERWLLCD